jgi:hypothetical protein
LARRRPFPSTPKGLEARRASKRPGRRTHPHGAPGGENETSILTPHAAWSPRGATPACHDARNPVRRPLAFSPLRTRTPSPSGPWRIRSTASRDRSSPKPRRKGRTPTNAHAHGLSRDRPRQRHAAPAPASRARITKTKSVDILPNDVGHSSPQGRRPAPPAAPPEFLSRRPYGAVSTSRPPTAAGAPRRARRRRPPA